MKIVRKYMISKLFEDIRTRYSEFSKISVDYEVSEKVESVAVVPSKAKWRNLGMWSILTDELHKTVKGNAVRVLIARIPISST